MGKLKRKLQSPSIRSGAMIALVGLMVVFGVAVKLASRASVALPSDLNNDGVVNVMDLSMLLANWGKSGTGELNGDNSVNIFDLSKLLADWGKTATPSPSAPAVTPSPAPTSSGTPTVSGALYYVSNSGNDANTGRSAMSAWKTMGKVNAQLSNGSIKYGDGIVFERGGEFYGTIKAPTASVTGAWLTVGAYGTGPRPIISGYKIVDNQGAWTNTGNNIWKLNLVDGSSYRGMLPSETNNNNANVGFIRANGTIYGAKKWSLSNVSAQWDFYNDGTYVYVKSSANPSALASDLRIATNMILVRGFPYLRLQGVELIGSGGHGYQQTVGHTRVSDCVIHEIGGSQLGTSGTTRYGNGVELWLGTSDTIVDNNQIYDVYDTATTIQGSEARSSDLHFTNNKIWDTTQAFEYWTMGSNTSNGIYSSSWTDNVVINAGYSWGYLVRPDNTNGQGTALMAYQQQLPVSLDVSRNIFFNPRNNYVYSSPLGGYFKAGYVANHNVIALRPAEKIDAQLSYTYEQSAQYVAATHQDAQSTWMLVPSNATNPPDALTYVDANLASLKGMIH